MTLCRYSAFMYIYHRTLNGAIIPIFTHILFLACKFYIYVHICEKITQSKVTIDCDTNAMPVDRL